MSDSVKVRLKVEVEVEVGVWGAKTNFDELKEQVTREGITKLRNALATAKNGSTFKIVGPIALNFVMFEKEL